MHHPVSSYPLTTRHIALSVLQLKTPINILMTKGRTPDQGPAADDNELAIKLYDDALDDISRGNIAGATKALIDAIRYNHEVLRYAISNNIFAQLSFYDICKSIDAEIDSTEVDLLLICFYEFEQNNNNLRAHAVLKRVYSRPENFDRLDHLDSHNLLKTDLLKNYKNDIIQWRKQIHEKTSAEADPIVMKAIRDLHEKFVQVINRVDTEATANRAAAEAARNHAATEAAANRADAEAARNHAAAEAATNRAAAEARQVLDDELAVLRNNRDAILNEINTLLGYLNNDIDTSQKYNPSDLKSALSRSRARINTLSTQVQLYFQEWIRVRVHHSPADNNDMLQNVQQLGYALRACSERLEELKSALLT